MSGLPRRPPGSARQVENWIAGATLELSSVDLVQITAAIKRTGAGDGPASPEDVEAWHWEGEVRE